MYRLLKLLLLVIMAWSLSVSATENKSPSRDAEGNIVPTPRGPACIAPAEEMRKEHMTMLLHQRDKTVQQGIRNSKASLTACIDCHVTPDASGTVARNGEEGFFCSNCHQAASVKIDCFECHADRPAAMISQSNAKAHASALTFSRLSLPYALRLRLGDSFDLVDP